MQTFLCEPTFSLALSHLDTKRLGKQRVEAYQILLALGDEWAWSVYTGKKTFETYGWKNHPAVLMWKDNQDALIHYYNMCLSEWVKRGYKNNMPFLVEITAPTKLLEMGIRWYNQEFVTSHRCRLLQKNYEYYSQFNWQVPDNWQEVDYIWPTKR